MVCGGRGGVGTLLSSRRRGAIEDWGGEGKRTLAGFSLERQAE